MTLIFAARLSAATSDLATSGEALIFLTSIRLLFARLSQTPMASLLA